MNSQTRRGIAAAALLVLVPGVAACAGGPSSNASGGGGGSSTAHGPASVPARASQFDSARGAAEGTAVTDQVIRRKVIATGSVEVTARNVGAVQRRAEALVKGLSGFVADEEGTSNRHGDLRSVDLTLRVPSASFGTAMDALAHDGVLQHREQSMQDVTTQVIDLAARVRAQAASVRSIERLYRRATTIGQVMSIEAQLSQRQARLESLKRQQKYLADQTSLSTITMTIEHRAHPTPPAAHRTGFLGGLQHGWHGLVATAAALLTVVGAVLPFAAVAGLALVPIALVRRRRRLQVSPPTS